MLGEAILLWVSSETQRPFTSGNISETTAEEGRFFFLVVQILKYLKYNLLKQIILEFLNLILKQ